jgi:hypothetical protein
MRQPALVMAPTKTLAGFTFTHSSSPIHPLLHPHAQHCCTPMLNTLLQPKAHCPLKKCMTRHLSLPAPLGHSRRLLGPLLVSQPRSRSHGLSLRHGHAKVQNVGFEPAAQPSPLAVRAARGERDFRGGSGRGNAGRALEAPV